MGDSGPDVIEADRAQIVGDQRGRGHLAVDEFRVCVDLMSDLGDLRHQPFHLVVDGGMLCAGRPGDQPHDDGRDDETHRFILLRLVSGQKAPGARMRTQAAPDDGLVLRTSVL